MLQKKKPSLVSQATQGDSLSKALRYFCFTRTCDMKVYLNKKQITDSENDGVHCYLPFLQGIGELFEKIKQENKANGQLESNPGLFFTNLYVTPVLRNISLYLEKGKMLAVAGSTGSGKVSERKK